MTFNMTEEALHSRRIRSFVRRNSRLTSGQKKALENHWREYGIEIKGELPALDTVFGRRAPCVLDIGSGMGDTTIEMACRHPGLNFVAVEVHQPGVGNLIRRAHSGDITNVRIISEDIVDVLHSKALVNAFDKILILFPDPWPKKRHHKRRLITTTFIDALLPCLKRHGRLYIATDWQDYAEQILDVCDQHPSLANLAGKGCYAPRPAWRPPTKFENRGLGLGHEVRDLAYRLNEASLPQNDQSLEIR